MRIAACFLFTLAAMSCTREVRGGGDRPPSQCDAATARPPVADALGRTREINYYPSANNWEHMWSQWDASVIDADFTRLAALHANTVRLLIHVPIFGYPNPSPLLLDHLAQTIAIADRHGLKSHLTLFDFWKGYTDFAGSKAWARAIVAPFACDARIAVIEAQNEIDPGDADAMAWARHMIPYLRALGKGIPVTISEFDLPRMQSLVAQLAASPPDFWDFHYYGTNPAAGIAYASTKQLVGSTPLFIGETGYSTEPTSPRGTPSGLPATPGAREAFQDFYVRGQFHLAAKLGLPAPSLWILNDFVPGSIVDWNAGAPEYDFGLYRTDGSAKPVVATLTALYGGAPADLGFNGGFEAGDALPDLWALWHPDQAHFARDAAVAHGGMASARIGGSSGDASGRPSYYLYPLDAGVSPGQTRTASVWARGSASSGSNRVALVWFDAANKYIGMTPSADLPAGNSGWTQLVASGAAPANAALVQIALQSYMNSGTVWFDDVVFN